MRREKMEKKRVKKKMGNRKAERNRKMEKN